MQQASMSRAERDIALREATALRAEKEAASHAQLQLRQPMLQWEQRYISLQQALSDMFFTGGGLEKFEIVGALGRGAMGMVLKCRVRGNPRVARLAEFVAVKVRADSRAVQILTLVCKGDSELRSSLVWSGRILPP